MDDRPPIPLEYSSVAEEQKREEDRRRERCEALDNYNESTFGERHPYRNAFLVAVVIAGVGLASFLVREWLGQGMASIVIFLFVIAVGAASIVLYWVRQR